jgi:hypothetical protein
MRKQPACLAVHAAALTAGAAQAQGAKNEISFELRGEAVRPAELSRGQAPNSALGQAHHGYSTPTATTITAGTTTITTAGSGITSAPAAISAARPDADRGGPPGPPLSFRGGTKPWRRAAAAVAARVLHSHMPQAISPAS